MKRKTKKKTSLFQMGVASPVVMMILFIPSILYSEGKPAGEQSEKQTDNSFLKKLENLTKGESLTIEGKAHLRYWLDIQDATVEQEGESEPHKNSFELTRFYFGIKSKLTPWLSMRFTTDVGPEKKNVKTSEEQGHTHTVSGDQDYHLYVKYAWFQVNFVKDFYLRAGVIDNPLNDFTDNFWGYRYVFKNIGDEEKLWNSADLGAYFCWKIPRKLGDITVGFVNGAGYKNALDIDEVKDLWVHIMLSPLATISKHLENLYIGAYLQAPMGWKDGADRAILMSWFAGYASAWLTFGYQPLLRHLVDGKTGNIAWGIGHGLYLRFDTPAKVGIFGRGVLWDPDKDSAEAQMKYQFLGGLSYTPVKFLAIAASTVITWFSEYETQPAAQEKEIKFMLNSQLEF